MHIQSSQGIQLKDVGIIGAESGVRLLDSTVNMERCSIASSGTLLLVENSNSKLVDCRMCDSRSGDGLVATGKFSYVAAKGCQFLDNFGCCVYMFDGAGGAFEGCTFKGAKEYVGMALKDVGTRVSAVDCEFSDNGRNGMAVGGGACASLDQCTLQNTRKFHGLAISDPGSKVMASDCKFHDNEQCGVFVANQASVTLERCFSKRARQFSGVAIKDKWSTLLATGCEFAENQHSGVAAGAGSSVTLNSCVLKGAKDFYGLGVTGDGTEVVSRDCQFLDNRRCGVYVYSGGKASLEKCISKGATEFDGLAVFGKGSVSNTSSELVAEGCLFVDNKRNGVTVGGGASVKLIECISRRSDTVSTNSGRGLSVIGKKSRVTIHRCNFGDTMNEKQKFYRVLGCFS
ncbi:hypothetical protein BSKO_13317 [Bryopsis sp. KO-2023]|nr:hypothetical protein BSKO_13317 [Bryopsis sp. KO-2023]